MLGSEIFAESAALAQGPPLPSVLLLIDPSFASLPWEGLPLVEKFFGGEALSLMLALCSFYARSMLVDKILPTNLIFLSSYFATAFESLFL